MMIQNTVQMAPKPQAVLLSSTLPPVEAGEYMHSISSLQR